MRKKGFIFLGVMPLLYILGIIIILGLLVWFGYRISDGLVSMFEFLKDWWWALALSMTSFIYRNQIKMIIGRIFNL
jgi:hypothetical protein